jgi:hypothetical protein
MHKTEKSFAEPPILELHVIIANRNVADENTRRMPKRSVTHPKRELRQRHWLTGVASMRPFELSIS